MAVSMGRLTPHHDLSRSPHLDKVGHHAARQRVDLGVRRIEADNGDLVLDIQLEVLAWFGNADLHEAGESGRP